MITCEYQVPMECSLCKSLVFFVEMESGNIYCECRKCRWRAKQE